MGTPHRESLYNGHPHRESFYNGHPPQRILIMGPHIVKFHIDSHLIYIYIYTHTHIYVHIYSMISFESENDVISLFIPTCFCGGEVSHVVGDKDNQKRRALFVLSVMPDPSFFIFIKTEIPKNGGLAVQVCRAVWLCLLGCKCVVGRKRTTPPNPNQFC